LQTSNISVATSSSLDLGSRTDHGSIGIPKSSSYNLIDPNYFRESSDAPGYFTFGSTRHDVYQTSLSSTYPSQASGATPVNVAYNSTSSIKEGLYQFQWQNRSDKWYYLPFSSGACCNTPPSLAAPGDEYKIMVCRSNRSLLRPSRGQLSHWEWGNASA
jgi:arabinan endo-1,5-alpha-L-arabinosidase